MKTEKVARGERVKRSVRPVKVRVNVEKRQEVSPALPQQIVERSPVKKNVVDVQSAPSLAKPSHPQTQKTSSFLQPEQFFAELKVKSDAGKLAVNKTQRLDNKPRKGAAVSLGPPSSRLKKSAYPHVSNESKDAFSCETQPVANRVIKSRTSERNEQESRTSRQVENLELFSEPSDSVPTLELCYQGKPAPAPAQLRTRASTSPSLNLTPLADKSYRARETESSAPVVVDKSSEILRRSTEAVDLPGSPLLQNSSSQGTSGRFFKGESPAMIKMQKIVRSLSGKNDIVNSSHASELQPSQSSSETAEVSSVKRTGRLRRFLKSLERKLGKKSSKEGSGSKIGKIEQRGRVHKERQASDGAEKISDRNILDEDVLCFSPRSEVSSVSTTYSEVSSKSHSYKQSQHKKTLKSEVVKSKLWLLRVHQRVQGRSSKESEDEGDGIYEALRRGAMFSDTEETTVKVEAKKIPGNGSSAKYAWEKNSISKLVAKHKRNSTWDAGNLNLTDHIFSPKQPQLPSRDAQVLLAPPKKLTGDLRDNGSQQRGIKPSPLNTQEQSPTSIATQVTESSPSSVKSPAASEHQVATLASDCLQGISLPLPAFSFHETPSVSLTAIPSDWTDSFKSARSSIQNSSAPISPENLTPSQRSSFRSFPGFNSPLPLPVRAGSAPTSPGLYAAACPSPLSLPKSPRRYTTFPSSGGMQCPPASPGVYGASSISPGGVEFQSSLFSGWNANQQNASPHSPEFTTWENFSLDDNTGTTQQSGLWSRSDLAMTRWGVKSQDPVRTVSDERESAEKPRAGVGRNAVLLPASPRPPGLSFEQIVAGRNRSPPTDNTLMKFFFKCREIEHLKKFLALQKRRFLESCNADSEKRFHMILSEAGGGLSSMVSTLCTAWLLENTMASATAAKWHPVPVMNIRQKEMWEHRDTAWLFHVCGIEASAVLFVDEIPPINENAVAGRVKRALIGKDILVTKDEVASSCTIVSEKFRQEAPKLLQARYMNTLLLAGILVDTNNLSSGSARDKQQATILLVGAGSMGRNGLHNHLINIQDENYETSFIKETYGDSTALTGEKPATSAEGGNQLSKATPNGTTLNNDDHTEHPTPPSLASPTHATDSPAPISPFLAPPQNPISKTRSNSELEAKPATDNKPSPNKKDSSKITDAFRRLRNLSSVH